MEAVGSGFPRGAEAEMLTLRSGRRELPAKIVASLCAVLWTAIAPAGAIAEPAPGPVEIAIDVRPGSAANEVNPHARGAPSFTGPRKFGQ